MSDLAAALHAFAAEHRARGDVAIEDHLARAPRSLRASLAEGIDAYLAEAVRRDFTSAAYRASRAPGLVASLTASLEVYDRPSSG